MFAAYMQGCDRYKYFRSLNQIQNQIKLVLLVLTDTKIRYHYGKMANCVSPNRSKLGWFFWFGPIHVTIRRNLGEMILLIFLAAFVAVDKGKKEIERGILKRGTLQGPLKSRGSTLFIRKFWKKKPF